MTRLQLNEELEKALILLSSLVSEIEFDGGASEKTVEKAKAFLDQFGK